MSSAIGPGDHVQAVATASDDSAVRIRAGSRWFVARLENNTGECVACGDLRPGLILANDPVPCGTLVTVGGLTFEHGGWCCCLFRVIDSGEERDGHCVGARPPVKKGKARVIPIRVVTTADLDWADHLGARP